MIELRCNMLYPGPIRLISEVLARRESESLKREARALVAAAAAAYTLFPWALARPLVALVCFEKVYLA